MDEQNLPAPEFDLAGQVRNIRANAEMVVRMFAKETEFEFGFNDESVKWLDGYIEYIRKSQWTDEEIQQMISNLGSYLGETIIAEFGGSWVLDQRGWAVRWDEFNRAYPFIKVAKHFKNGANDSIYSFYTVTAALRKG